MKKNIVKNVIIHAQDGTDFPALADRVSEFHAAVIERRLNGTHLTSEQKISIIDKIIINLQSREVGNIIK